jgi:hypothetical protein
LPVGFAASFYSASAAKQGLGSTISQPEPVAKFKQTETEIQLTDDEPCLGNEGPVNGLVLRLGTGGTGAILRPYDGATRHSNVVRDG